MESRTERRWEHIIQLTKDLGSNEYSADYIRDYLISDEDIEDMSDVEFYERCDDIKMSIRSMIG